MSIPPCTVWKPQSHWLVADRLRPWSQGAARVASPDKVEVPPHPERIGFHPRISYDSNNPGTKTEIPWVDIPPCKVWKPQPNWPVAGWLRLTEPARGESCPSGQRRGYAAPGEDSIVSPEENSLHISTLPTTRGRKRRSPGSVPPRMVWKPQPHWLVAD